MDRPFPYTPDKWLLTACIGVLLVLMGYGWRRRAIPGAWYFAMASLYAALWATGALFSLAAHRATAKLFWAVFAGGWQIPAITALLCFMIQYAGLGHWLTRRRLLLLATPPFLYLGLALTNRFHSLLWIAYTLTPSVELRHGRAGWLLVIYGELLYLAGFVVLAWLFKTAPQRRRATTIIAFGLLAGGVAFALEPLLSLDGGPVSPLVLGVTVAVAAFALALFRYRILPPVTEARGLVIEQMRDGMLVLDGDQIIVDLNPAAGQILGLAPGQVNGRRLIDVFPGAPDLAAALATPGHLSYKLELGRGASARAYDLHISPLHDGSGAALGQLVLFREITAEKRVQPQLIEQQRITATLHERERLARELHDSAGQILGYVSMQAQAIAKLIRDGESERAATLTIRLAEVAQAAHHDIRESILGLKIGPADAWSFPTALRQTLEAFSRNYGIEAELSAPGGLSDQDFSQSAGVQVLRVIQEALSNARRHGQARHVRVSVECRGEGAQIAVTDDGCGFDPEQPLGPGSNQFGLKTMAERMAQVGGRVTIDSHPGAGTRVVLVLPHRRERPEAL
ncbi:MAG TPA: histidine kinase N-terminal 7TM domain-containing protein [Anaerolineae bacterium]